MRFLIFERAVNLDADRTFFVRLECDKENEVSLCTPQSIQIINHFGLSSPVIKVDFDDSRGDLFNHMKVNTGATFTLSFGRSLNDSFSIDLKIAKVDFHNITQGRSHDISFTIHFLVDNWFDAIAVKRNRGWSEIPYSEIVKEIAEESGYVVEDEYITETDGEPKSTVQPNWSNWKMLQYLREKAKPIEDSGHFEIGVSLNGDFKFMTTDAMIDYWKNEISDGSIPTLRLQGGDQSLKAQERDIINNGDIPTYFIAFRGMENYADGIKRGASGYTANWYDWNVGEYKTESSTFDQDPVKQLSEFSSIRETSVTDSTTYFGGRDEFVEQYAKNCMLENAHSMMSFDIATHGTGFIDIFDIVELIIPNSNLGSTVPINEMYSGFYLVAGVNHFISFGDITEFNSTITLTRHGVDYFDYQGFDDLIESSGGKF